MRPGETGGLDPLRPLRDDADVELRLEIDRVVIEAASFACLSRLFVQLGVAMILPRLALRVRPDNVPHFGRQMMGGRRMGD